ncbi:MAG: type II toxin-antitoxin system PemK/MazF family toxin [Opitutus sp.]|nr:type II toxin-antitoxin system PemK/MazF family toxin [Opitutus sp.]
MRRGDIVTVVASGDYGKPRPAVVVQADVLTASGLPSVLLCLISSHPVVVPVFRLPVDPGPGNGLIQRSQIMVDKILTVPRARIGSVIGRLDDETILRLNRTLAFVVGLAE